MKLLVAIALLFVGTAFTSVVDDLPIIEDAGSSEEILDEPGDQNEQGKGDICTVFDRVDLSDFKMKSAELKTLSEKEANVQKFANIAGEELALNDMKTKLSDNAMGVIRKMVILPNKKHILAKVLKSAKASGLFTTSVKGSLKTSVDASTEGRAEFDVDLKVYTKSRSPHHVVKGHSDIVANSSTAWVKQGERDVIQTKATASSASVISWSNAESTFGSGSLTVDAKASATANTVIMSAKCFVSTIEMAFNTKAAGTNWTGSFEGTGKGGVFTRVLFATKNGTSFSKSFARLSFKTQLEIQHGNTTLEGTQKIKVKVSSETITRPVESIGSDTNKNFEVSNEIKVRVGAKTKLNNGAKIFTTGGHLLFRTAKVAIPSQTVNFYHGEVDGDGKAADLMVGNVVRKQVVQADDIMVNPEFVNSVISAAMN